MKKTIKKLFLLFTVFALVFVLLSFFPTFAKTVTVQTATFTTYEMGYYNESISHWHIAEEAVFDDTCLEYLCVHNIAEMAPNKNYAAIKSYEIESDCDFYFAGEAYLDLPTNLFEGKSRDITTINFFVSTSKGKIIYPTDGSNYCTVSLASGKIAISGGINDAKAGDKIYFVAFTDSEINSPYLMCPVSVWETEPGGFRGNPVSDTNCFSETQGEFGWEFLFAPIDTLKFGTKEVTYDEFANVSTETPDIEIETLDGNVVISTGNAKPLPTSREVGQQLSDIKIILSVVIGIVAVVLIAQVIVLHTIRKKKGK